MFSVGFVNSSCINSFDSTEVPVMSKICTKCSKTVYPLEELKCLDKVSWFLATTYNTEAD